MTTHPHRRTQIDLIADNGGSLTLQVRHRPRYVHHYYGREIELADCLQDLLAGGHTRDWDGNEIEEVGWMEYDPETERNGGYCWYTGTTRQVVDHLTDRVESGRAGNAERALVRALRAHDGR